MILGGRINGKLKYHNYFFIMYNSHNNIWKNIIMAAKKNYSISNKYTFWWIINCFNKLYTVYYLVSI